MDDLAKLSKTQLMQLVATTKEQLSSTSQQLSSTTEQLNAASETISSQFETISSQSKEMKRREDVIKQLEGKLSELERDYLKLWQERFAAKSERYIDDPDQLRIDFGDTDQAADAAAGLAEAVDEADVPQPPRRKPRKKRDESLPSHLPRKEIVVDAADSNKQCAAHGEKELLPESMWDVVEKQVYVPPQLFVEVRKYKKYVCKGQPQCGVSSAERPTGIVEGDKIRHVSRRGDSRQ